MSLFCNDVLLLSWGKLAVSEVLLVIWTQWSRKQSDREISVSVSKRANGKRQQENERRVVLFAHRSTLWLPNRACSWELCTLEENLMSISQSVALCILIAACISNPSSGGPILCQCSHCQKNVTSFLLHHSYIILNLPALWDGKEEHPWLPKC